MTGASSQVRALVLSVLVVFVAVSGAAAIGAADSTTAGNASNSSSGELTYEELSTDGPTYSNAPPGVRFGEERMFWLVHWPASSPFSSPGEDDNWRYLGSGTTVGRNSVYLRSIVQETDAEAVTVHVVAWQKGEREVSRGNTTTTVPAAENVTHKRHIVDLERGWLLEEIPLGQHNERTRITMWVEGVDGARWTFQHKSVATTQSIAIDSWGDYLIHIGADFLWVVLLGMPFAGIVTKRALERAGRGPFGSYTPWLVLLTVFGSIGVLTLYQSLSELVVAAPFLIGVGLVALFTVVLLETYTSGVSKALFIQPKLTHATSPAGEEARDIIGFEAEEHTTVRMPRGGVAIIRSGVMAFLARVFGRAAFLDTRRRMATTIETERSKWDDVYLIDPEAPEVVDYSAEGWSLDFPPLDREHAGFWGVVGSSTGIVGLLVSQGIVGPLAGFGVLALGVIAWVATPTDGYARITPAPTHFRSAYGSIATLIEGYADAETIEEAKEQLDKERVRKAKDVEEELSKRDDTLIREMEGANIPATIEHDEGHDDVEEQRREYDPATDGGEDRD